MDSSCFNSIIFKVIFFQEECRGKATTSNTRYFFLSLSKIILDEETKFKEEFSCVLPVNSQLICRHCNNLLCFVWVKIFIYIKRDFVDNPI